MNPRSKIALIAALIAAGGIALATIVLSDPAKPPGQGPNPDRTLTSNCLKPSKKIATPDWYPADLPMPKGSFAIEVPGAASGLRRVIFQARGTLGQFVVHAIKEWKNQGWTLGRGESEPGEAEDNFLKGERYGIFRAQSVFCDTGATWVLMVLNDPSVKTAPTPSFNTRPSLKPSPLTTPG